jgi:glc operon protein GlcG
MKGLTGVVLALLLTIIAGSAQRAHSQSATAKAPYGQAISLANAEKMLDAAQQQADKMGYTGAIAIVGPAGELIAYRRLDGAALAQSAQNKAFAAVAYRRPTKAFQDVVAAGNFGVTTLPNVIASEGGLPIVSGGAIVGGIGASGGAPQDDGVVAAAGLSAVK